MGMWSNIGKAAAGSAISGAKQGLAKGIVKNGQVRDRTPLSDDEMIELMQTNYSNDSSPISFANALKKISAIDLKYADEGSPDFLPSTRTKLNIKSEETPVDYLEQSNILTFKTPDWDYGDFINERNMWQRQLTSISGDQGWFYFKVFFHFDTQQGLFGGILNDADVLHAANSAGKFLKISQSQNNTLYSKANLSSRLISLYKFTSILSYITTNAPWFFKAVKGMQNANMVINKDYTKEKSIEITCNPDAIDMRLNTMMDLYKYAVWDNINYKEIVPENLRKFDMTVLVFNTPIKKIHTAIRSKLVGNFGYKNMINATTNFDNAMSYKMFTFKNCEFDMKSLHMLFPADLNNETPFQLGNAAIKILYDRVYTHTSNEFFGLFFGDDGMYFNQYGNTDGTNPDKRVINASINYTQKQRYLAMQKALVNFRFNPRSKQHYKELIDASEDLSNVLIYNKLDAISEAGQNALLSLLKVNLSSSGILGNLYGDYAPGSTYFKDKIKKLKAGRGHGSLESNYLSLKDSYDNFNVKDYLNGKVRKIRYS